MVHIPVLLKEIIEVLNPQPEKFFIDGTVGGGGHSASILEKIMPAGKLLAVDWDKNILEKTRREIEAKFQIPNSKFQIFWIHGNYADLPEILEKYKLPKADGLIIDLGMSSDQLEKSGKGFSFLRNEPLDMRYNVQTNADDTQTNTENISVNQHPYQRQSAATVINNRSEKELVDIFRKYGEERYARQIAKKIVEERKKKPIRTTFELVEVIKKAVPQSYEKHRIHPATRVFQALRIYVNNELGNLEKLLKSLVEILKPGGRAAIISYHSLEDRLVKNYFRELKNQGKAVILTKRPIRPTLEEVKNNPRARSAKLRAIQLISRDL